MPRNAISADDALVVPVPSNEGLRKAPQAGIFVHPVSPRAMSGWSNPAILVDMFVFKRPHAKRVAPSLAALLAVSLIHPSIASAGPSGVNDAESVIARLRDRGDLVVLSKIGDAPLAQCIVTGVTEGNSVYRYERPVGIHSNRPFQELLDHRTMFVDLRC